MTQKKPHETEASIPEKPGLLARLKETGFHVPAFIYLPAEDFQNENFDALKCFFDDCCDMFKVIARSAHPQEKFYKGGTFDSLETYADVAGIVYARKRMIKSIQTRKRLTIARQQQFNHAPPLDLEEMGVMVMPYVDGFNVMAKMIGSHWEFGYSGDRSHKVLAEPYITQTPHDRKLLDLSREIQNFLGFRCEIEYIVSEDGTLHVVQAKDISHVEMPEQREDAANIKLDGVRRVRRRHNYRERPIFVMDNISLYLHIISMCEDLVAAADETDASPDDAPDHGPARTIDAILDYISTFERNMESFALRHERFGLLGISIQVPADLYQIANHYLDDMPDLQKRLCQTLRENLYKIDYFMSEADTLIAKSRIRVNIGTHDAYGIDTVRNPLWSVYWHVDRHEAVVRRLRKIGFRTGDTVSIEIDPDEKPTLRRL